MMTARKFFAGILLVAIVSYTIVCSCSRNVDVPLKLMRAEDVVRMEAETNGAWYRIEPVKRFVVPSKFYNIVYKYLGRETRTWKPASKEAIRKYQLGTVYLEGKDGTITSLGFYTSGNGCIGLSNDNRLYMSFFDDDKEDGGQSLLLLLNEVSLSLKKTD